MAAPRSHRETAPKYCCSEKRRSQHAQHSETAALCIQVSFLLNRQPILKDLTNVMRTQAKYGTYQPL